MRCGVFDSGVGGLSVLKSLYEAHLFSDIVYYGDTARVPYGSKDRDTIIEFGKDGARFFASYDIDVLVVACNTLSAYALPAMRSISSFEIYGVIDAGIKSCINTLDTDASVLVLGTSATIASGLYERGLREASFTHIASLATPLFVPIVEEEIRDDALLDAAFSMYFRGIDTKRLEGIILGCTHFPFLEPQFRRYFGNDIRLIHSGLAIVEYLEAVGLKRGAFKNTRLSFHASSDEAKLAALADRYIL